MAGWVVVVDVVVVVVGIGLAIVWMGYDKAIRLDEAVSKQWAQVDTVLARRFDLIPNLVETVKGYAAHERAVFDEVTAARKPDLRWQSKPQTK